MIGGRQLDLGIPSVAFGMRSGLRGRDGWGVRITGSGLSFRLGRDSIGTCSGKRTGPG